MPAVRAGTRTGLLQRGHLRGLGRQRQHAAAGDPVQQHHDVRPALQRQRHFRGLPGAQPLRQRHRGHPHRAAGAGRAGRGAQRDLLRAPLLRVRGGRGQHDAQRHARGRRHVPVHGVLRAALQGALPADAARRGRQRGVPRDRGQHEGQLARDEAHQHRQHPVLRGRGHRRARPVRAEPLPDLWLLRAAGHALLAGALLLPPAERAFPEQGADALPAHPYKGQRDTLHVLRQINSNN